MLKLNYQELPLVPYDAEQLINQAIPITFILVVEWVVDAAPELASSDWTNGFFEVVWPLFLLSRRFHVQRSFRFDQD